MEAESSHWILIAEDDANDAFFMQRVLRDVAPRHTLVMVRTGGDALACLRGEAPEFEHPPGAPDLVILDQMIPEVPGVRVLEQIKADPKLREIPVVMHSGLMTREQVKEAYALGANGFVPKPGNLDDFNKIFTSIGLFWLRANVHPNCPELLELVKRW